MRGEFLHAGPDLDACESELAGEFSPGRREADAVRHTPEEWDLHHALEIAGGAMEGGLGHAERLCRLPEAARPPDRDQAADVDIADLAREPRNRIALAIAANRRGDGGVDLPKETPRPAGKDEALRCQEAAGAATLDQPHAEFGFERLHRPADRRLG
jgi:hypothetical protein